MDKSAFDENAAHPLQTWEWGEFRKATGNEVLRTKYGQITTHPIPLTNYRVGAFIKGPKPTKAMLDDLAKLAKEQNLIFIKLEPNTRKDDKLINLLKESGAVAGKTLFTPTTFAIDLTKSEEELLKSFSGKTRYNVRLAQKRGVVVNEEDSSNAFDKYLELTFETAKRQGFFAHNKNYHRLMWKHLHTDLLAEGQQPVAHLFTAKYKGEIITTWILLVWKDTLYYPYGASSDKYREVMANNLMMWEAILFGKKLGLKTFDLWGREEGKGFTKFKEGYNPEVVEFLGTWDLVISPALYRLYRAAESIRWLVLRLRSKTVKPKS